MLEIIKIKINYMMINFTGQNYSSYNNSWLIGRLTVFNWVRESHREGGGASSGLINWLLFIFGCLMYG